MKPPEPEFKSPINLPSLSGQILYSLSHATRIFNWDMLRLKGAIACLKILTSTHMNTEYQRVLLNRDITNIELSLRMHIDENRRSIKHKFSLLNRGQTK